MGDGAGDASRQRAGADVRPADAARAQHHGRRAPAERGRLRLLQVGAAARPRRPVADHRRHGRRGRPVRPHPARRLRRPARLLRYGRRRRLRRRLRARRGSQPADRPGARQRDRRRAGHPRRDGDRARARALHVQAHRQGPCAGHPQAGRRAEGRRPRGLAGAARHRHLPRGDQPLVRPQPPRRATRRPRRHLRAERDQGAVPRRGRRRRGRQRAAARRRTRQVRRPARQPGLHGPARPQRPGDPDDRRRARTARDEGPGPGSARPGPARAGHVQEPGAEAARSGCELDRRAAPGGFERPARRRRALGDRHADVRGRPADLLQLPGPDARDGALRAAASASAARPPPRSPDTC